MNTKIENEKNLTRETPHFEPITQEDMQILIAIQDPEKRKLAISILKEYGTLPADFPVAHEKRQ